METNTKTIEVDIRSYNKNARMLSNFYLKSFILTKPFAPEDFKVSTVVSFMLFILVPPENPQRSEILELCGRETRKRKKEMEENREIEGKLVYWYDKKGQDVTFPFGSEEHYALIKTVMKEKFKQNPGLKKALISTEDKEITCSPKEKEKTYLPEDIFCKFLKEIRTELQWIEV